MENEQTNPTLERIEDFLREMVEALEPIQTDPIGRGRLRILPALCLWAGVLVCVLRGWSSQLGIWRLVKHRGLWDYPRFAIGDQAVYKRLEKGGEDPLKRLFEQVSAVLAERLQPYLQPIARFASEVVAIDETTLDKVMRHLPLLRGVADGDHPLLPGKLAGVFDIRLQQWRYVEHIPNPHENERVAAPFLLAHLQLGALILMDLGFFGFEWFDQLTQEGYFWISRLRQKTSYQIIHTFYHQGQTLDALIWLGAHRADRARYAVRLVTFQVWAVLLISQILHGLQLEIAAKAGVDPFDVSLPLLVEYLPRWKDVDFIVLVVDRGRDAGFIRPSRRIRIQTPPIDLKDYLPPPADLILVHEPRYAHRNCVIP